MDFGVKVLAPARGGMSFRGQLALWFGGLSLASLLGVGFYVGRIAADQLEASVGETLSASAQSATELLETHLRERALEIELLAQSALFRRGDLSGPDVRHALELRKTAHGEYAWIGVSDVQGRILQATGGLLIGQSAEQRPWFKAGLSAPFAGDVHDAVLLAKLLPKPPSEQPLRLIDFSAPIRDDSGHLRGVLAAHAVWSWVTEVIESAVSERLSQRQAEVLIATRDGHILYPFQQAGALALPARVHPEAHYEVLRWGDEGDFLTSVVALRPVANADLAWRIVVRQPLAEARAPAVALWRRLLLLGVAAALGFGFVAYRLAARISRPVEQLARAAQAVERGEAPPPFPGQGQTHEIALLTRSMGSMIASLLSRERDLARLNATLESQVAQRTAELTRANAQLERLSSSDGLTGLYNRRRFDEKLHELFLTARRTGGTHGLLVVDVDHFKRVNDSYGHPAGDEVLRQVARRLSDAVRATDVVARYGGEEFMVLLPQVDDPEAARAVAEKIRAAVRASPFPQAGTVTVSIGVSVMDASDATEQEIVQRADRALYEAKAQGRDRVCVRWGCEVEA